VILFAIYGFVLYIKLNSTALQYACRATREEDGELWMSQIDYRTGFGMSRTWQIKRCRTCELW